MNFSLSNKRKKHNISVYSVLCFTILILYSLLMVFFVLWSIITSLKTEIDFSKHPLSLPQKWMFSNYSVAFKYFKIEFTELENGSPVTYAYYLSDMLGNSILYALGCTFFATMVPCLVAYACAKYNFKFNKIIIGAVLFAMAVPIVGSLPSEIKIARAIGFYDTLWGNWLMKANFLGMYFLVFYANFKEIPWDYAEAIFIDGGNHYTVLNRVMLPLSKTTIFAVAVLLFIGFWNDYQTPLTFLPSMPTASYGLYYFTYATNMTDPVTHVNISSIPMRITGCIILMIPMIILFIIMRKRIMGNLTVGGIKG